MHLFCVFTHSDPIPVTVRLPVKFIIASMVDRSNGCGTHSAHQTAHLNWHNDKLDRQSDGDGNGVGICKPTLISIEMVLPCSPFLRFYNAVCENSLNKDLGTGPSL